MTPAMTQAARFANFVRFLAYMSGVAFGALAVLVFLLVYDACKPLSSDDQFEWNLLTSTLRDWERPTEANAFIRAEECREWPTRAERYRRIKRMFVGAKVDRYAEFCRTANATTDRGERK